MAAEASKVSRTDVFLVRPSESVERRTQFLSLADQRHGYFCQNIFFFRSHPGIDLVVEQLKLSLSKLLVSYSDWAGRLRINEENKVEIDCSSAGALLASATCKLSLSEITEDEFDELCFSPDGKALEELPLVTVQVTHLEGDGGLVVTMLQLHVLSDALSAMNFLLNLSSLSRGRDLVSIPSSDRTPLKARVPRQVKFQHTEFSRHFNSRFTLNVESILNSEKARKKVVRRARRLYHFGSERLNELKQLAMQDGLLSRCTSFEALAAFVWRAHVHTLPDKKPDDVLRLRFPMDIRNILQPPLGDNFCGNAAFGAIAEMTLKDICHLPLSRLVSRIQEARSKITDEYVRSAYDFLEEHPDHWYRFDTQVNAWPKLMVKSFELDFGWGKPCRVEYPLDERSTSIIFFPFHPYGNVDGFHVSVNLDSASLPVFENHLSLRGGLTPLANEHWQVPFSSFVFPEKDRADVAYDCFASDEEFPIVDMEASDMIYQVDNAAKESGFFQLVNHGVPLETIHEMQAAARHLFSLPMEQKLAIKHADKSLLGYGCAGYGRNFWNEGFQVVDEPGMIKAYADKLWPDDETSARKFCDAVEKYTTDVRGVGFRLLNAFEEVLNLRSGTLSRYCKREVMNLRLYLYPACPDPSSTFGLPPHYDKHFITLLHQDEIGGLQIQKNGRWLGLKPRTDAFIINIGDTLKVLSNDRYKSVRHRVVTNSVLGRLSMPYLMNPVPDDVIYPEEFADPEHPVMYRPFTYKELVNAVDDNRNSAEGYTTSYLKLFKIK